MKFKIKCTGTREIDVDDLVPFQGGLKDLTKDGFEKLKKEILETGYAFPIRVWENKGVNYIIGGHQTQRTLKTMRRLGYEIPPIPVIDIQADSEREAKRRVLQDASQYGVVNEDGFAEFLNECEFDLDFAESSFRLPDMKWDKFFESHGAEIDPVEKGRSASEDVKQIVLKFDLETHGKFLQFIESLSHKYETKSVTDTIFACLRADFLS